MASNADVFISYASDTKPLAEELAKALESQGIEPWADFKDLHPGQRFAEEIKRAADSAWSFVILVGSDSRATRWQEAEWTAALAQTWADEKKKLLPVVFGNIEPPPFLRNWVSLRVDPEAEASAWTGEVLSALRRLRNENVHGSRPQSQEERRKRLDEMSRAAEEFAKRQREEPPASSPKAHSE